MDRAEEPPSMLFVEETSSAGFSAHVVESEPSWSSDDCVSIRQKKDLELIGEYVESSSSIKSSASLDDPAANMLPGMVEDEVPFPDVLHCAKRDFTVLNEEDTTRSSCPALSSTSLNDSNALPGTLVADSPVAVGTFEDEKPYCVACEEPVPEKKDIELQELHEIDPKSSPAPSLGVRFRRRVFSFITHNLFNLLISMVVAVVCSGIAMVDGMLSFRNYWIEIDDDKPIWWRVFFSIEGGVALPIIYLVIFGPLASMLGWPHVRLKWKVLIYFIIFGVIVPGGYDIILRATLMWKFDREILLEIAPLFLLFFILCFFNGFVVASHRFPPSVAPVPPSSQLTPSLHVNCNEHSPEGDPSNEPKQEEQSSLVLAEPSHSKPEDALSVEEPLHSHFAEANINKTLELPEGSDYVKIALGAFLSKTRARKVISMVVLFGVPLCALCAWLAVLEFTLMAWYLHDPDDMVAKLVVRTIVSPVFFSVLVFLGKFCGRRMVLLNYPKTKSNSEETLPIARNPFHADADGSSKENRKKAFERYGVGTSLALASIFTGSFFGRIFAVGLNDIQAVIIGCVVVSSMNIVLRLVLWNKWRFKKPVTSFLRSRKSPWLKRLSDNRLLSVLFHCYKHDDYYAFFIACDNIYEIATIVVAHVYYLLWYGFLQVHTFGSDPLSWSNRGAYCFQSFMIQLAFDLVTHWIQDIIGVLHDIPMHDVVWTPNMLFMLIVQAGGACAFVSLRAFAIFCGQWIV